MRNLIYLLLCTAACGEVQAEELGQEEVRSPQAVDRALAALEKKVADLDRAQRADVMHELKIGTYVSGFDTHSGLGGFMLPIYSPKPVRISRVIFVARVSSGSANVGAALYRLDHASLARANTPDTPGSTMGTRATYDATLIAAGQNVVPIVSAGFVTYAVDFDKDYTVPGDGSAVIAFQSSDADVYFQGYDTDAIDHALGFAYDGTSRTANDFPRQLTTTNNGEASFYVVLRSSQARGLASH